MLTRVSIHNYSCFVGFQLELPRRLLLVGSNGSGKTSLWRALAGLQDVIVHGTDVADVFPTTTLTRWLHDDPIQRFAITVRSGADTFTYDLDLEHDVTKQRVSIHRERLAVGDRPIYEQSDRRVRLHDDAGSP